MAEPTLEDDETALASYAAALGDALEIAVPGWLRRLITMRAPRLLPSPTIEEAIDSAASALVADLRTLLSRDIADQLSGPLEVLRRGVGVPTAILAEAAVPPPTRDEFARNNFPDDVYDLAPASFASVDPALHEPGLMWGAAKAHVHLRRRRETVAE